MLRKKFCFIVNFSEFTWQHCIDATYVDHNKWYIYLAQEKIQAEAPFVCDLVY